VAEPAAAPEPTTEEIERLLAEVPIFRMLSPADVHALALGSRPLLLGPTQRFVIEGREGTSLFLVGEGEVEVRLRKSDGTDWLVEDDGPRRGGRGDGPPPRVSGARDRQVRGRDCRVRDRPGAVRAAAARPIPSGWRSWPASLEERSPGAGSA
jgi:hypothetical protein